MPEIDLTLTIDDDPKALDELAQWLDRDPEIRQVQRIRKARPTQPDELGAGTDALQMLSDNPELLTAIVTTIGVWLGTRPRKTSIRVRQGDVEVDLDTTQPIDPVEAARSLIRETDAEPREE